MCIYILCVCVYFSSFIYLAFEAASYSTGKVSSRIAAIYPQDAAMRGL